jgi:hypothetical protein|tara:strand:- start:226 stop:378 length:153 start_codon:yes stop_codon:yes gene_type:complete
MVEKRFGPCLIPTLQINRTNKQGTDTSLLKLIPYLLQILSHQFDKEKNRK